MYNETGSKIKDSASSAAITGIMGSIILGIVIFILGYVYYRNGAYIMFIISCVLAIVVAVKGSISAWRKHLLMAGFGELIEKTCEISAQLAEMKEEKKAEQTEQPVASEEASSDDDTEYYSSETDTLNLEAAKAEASDAPKWKILRQCLEQGLITEEEYEKKMQEIYK